jgi:UDP-glucose 4-epimerase
MYILVTGGLGFIGSHIVVKLINIGYNVIVYDNLSNSDISILNKINKLTNAPEKILFMEGDIRNKSKLENLFNTYNIYIVIHLAALKSVSESEKYPELYNDVNINGSINLLKVMSEYKCNNFIYSSSATVYGNTQSPVDENSKTGNNLACNYARNKYDMEIYLNNNCREWNVVILRYFNPIGAHPSGLIGEEPNNIPNNVFPYLLRVAKWTNSIQQDKNSPYSIFTVFGNDYKTQDGTCMRDYIHVQDLAQAHTIIIPLFSNNIGIKTYNVGTGKGTSVLELIHALNNCLINNKKKPINYKIGVRRLGDLDISYANADKIYKEVGFKTVYNINDMCKDGLTFIGL